MEDNHIDLYPEEVQEVKDGTTITVTARNGDEVTIRMKPEYLFDERGEPTILGKSDMCGACGSDIDDGLYVRESKSNNSWLPVCDEDCRDSIGHLASAKTVKTFGDAR